MRGMARNPGPVAAARERSDAPYCPAKVGPAGDSTAATANSNSGIAERLELELRLIEGEPTGRARDWFVAGQQRVDGLEGLRHHLALLQVVQTHHGGVGWKRAWAHTEDVTTHRHVVELHRTGRHNERMMKRQRCGAGSETDPLGAFSSGSNEEIAPGDDLVPGRIMLTDPRFGIAQLLRPDDQLEVTP